MTLYNKLSYAIKGLMYCMDFAVFKYSSDYSHCTYSTGNGRTLTGHRARACVKCEHHPKTHIYSLTCQPEVLVFQDFQSAKDEDNPGSTRGYSQPIHIRIELQSVKWWNLYCSFALKVISQPLYEMKI